MSRSISNVPDVISTGHGDQIFLVPFCSEGTIHKPREKLVYLGMKGDFEAALKLMKECHLAIGPATRAYTEGCRRAAMNAAKRGSRRC